ncbi:uncharacterized protein LOC128035485 [Gossypium raimondii]|uniref:uncharacterized protein LOC128035485 n=1 Tax=Gossypium raimondii TaxID=29730 RepID=UPI00227D27BD|nr:uncharacterized protein LOC128035485 [Gossypium raimondii]
MPDLRVMFTRLSLFDDGSLLAELQVKPTWIEQIRGKQLGDKYLRYGVLCFHGQICVPNDEDLRQSILREAHGSPYTIHPGRNKMYRDFRELYWWSGLKCEVSDFVAYCLTCQQVKAKHQLPTGLLQPVKIPLWKWERKDCQSESVIQILEDMLRSCVIDFRGNWEEYLPLAEFAYNNSFQSSIQMAPYMALYSHKCRTSLCWTELGERRVLGLELVSEIEDNVRLIRDHLKATSDRQKSYADLKRHEIEYSVRGLSVS